MLRYGIIGCGMMGHEHIRNIQLLDNVAITALCEPDHKMLDIACSLAPNAKHFNTLEQMPFDQLDCLVIASPNFLHVDQLRYIAKQKNLPLLVEKPLATSANDRAFLEEFAKTYSAPVWVAMEYRYMPPIEKLIQQAKEATGGVTMLTIREHRYPFLEKVNDWNRFNRYSGGTLVEKCCHFFDLMRLIIQAEPVRIMASGGQAVNHLDEHYAEGTPDIWDNAYVIVDFDNGARAMLELCMYAEGSRYQESISAVGAEGKIECFVPGPARFWPDHLGPLPVPELVVSPRLNPGPVVTEIPLDPALLKIGDHNGSTFFQHQRFQQVVLGEAQAEITLLDGWKAVAMGMAAQISATEGRCVGLNDESHLLDPFV